jgi:protein-S-isoprenylcysteine O-methyltransferase Ste14
MGTSRAPQAPPQRDAPGVIAPPPLIYLGALAAGFVLEILLPSASIPALVRWPVGVALVLGGFALARSFIAAFDRAHTAVDPRRPTTAIVTTGPYRVTRNPGYAGLTLLYAGIAVLAGALWPLATLVAALVLVDRAVIAREERYLARKFGAEYEAYRRRVRRWL